MGVSITGLWLLSTLVLGISVLFGTHPYGNLSSIAVGAVGYLGLRILAHYSKPGWEESLVHPLEQLASKKTDQAAIEILGQFQEPVSPDTLDKSDELLNKAGLLERVLSLKTGEELILISSNGPSGASLSEVRSTGRFSRKSGQNLPSLFAPILGEAKYVYSLYQLPVTTDPLWVSQLVSKLPTPVQTVVRIRALDPHASKRQIELSRRRNAQAGARITDVDSEVTFEEASLVLQGLSRGDERVVELSLVVVSPHQLDLDPGLFCLEKETELSLLSAVGLRRRFHRSHWVRAVTATDLVPTLLDPVQSGPAFLSTPRGKPLYFSPQDARLEALHWLVVGASGSGKSFLTGLVLRRLVQAAGQISVLYIDHNRSFRRVVRADRGLYLEPQSLSELHSALPGLFRQLEPSRSVCGIELSDLALSEKKAAAHRLLSEVESFLRHRKTTHPIYIVLDECWNFLRDEPLLVQRAFREFRKLNGAAVAITQSLSDFLTDESGRSILQNAPVRILLRQGEDPAPYAGALGLNQTELARVRFLKQSKGHYSEALIKTPFLSRIGRLCPTQEEHDLLRTDNIREELLAEQMRARQQ
jgi:hypothetical protein